MCPCEFGRKCGYHREKEREEAQAKPLTVTEVLTSPVMEKNPDAAALAVGMVLMQQSSAEGARIRDSIIESQRAEIDRLRKQLREANDLAGRYLAIRRELTAPLPWEDEGIA